MSITKDKLQQASLARAVADFWKNGAGPTHRDIKDVLDTFGLNKGSGSKRDRVSEAIKLADPQDLIALVKELLDLLRRDGVFSPSSPFATEHDRLSEALAPYGIKLLEGGTTKRDSEVFIDASTLPDEAVVREHMQRLQLALDEDDPALLLGSSKELLESTAKIVLARIGEIPPAKFPALVTRALQVLMLHPKSSPEQREEAVEPVRKILGGVVQIAIEINELRGERGTGHGRAEAPVRLTSRHGRLAAGAAVLVSGLMFDTLDDESAPWCRETSWSGLTPSGSIANRNAAN